MDREMPEKPLITVSILLKGDQLDPDFVSQTLGISADKAQKKGEKREGTRSGKTYIARTGAWWARLDNKSRDFDNVSKAVAQLLAELLEKFRQRQKSLDQIAGVEQSYIDILILGDMEGEVGAAEFLLSKAQILRAGELGLGISVTTSFAAEE